MRVPVIIPPMAEDPRVLLPTAPAPSDKTRGMRPATKAKDVIRIGRNRILAPSRAAFSNDKPSFRLCTANSTINTAFLPSSPSKVITAICAYTSLARPINLSIEKEPNIPTGKEKSTASGSTKFSYWAASTK